MSFKHTAAAMEVCEGLTQTEKLVLLALAEYADAETGECYPSAGVVARKAMCTRESASRAMRSLQDKGYLTIRPRRRENGSQTSNSIIVLPPKKVVDDPSFGPAPCDLKSHPPVISDHTPCDLKSHPPVISDHTHNLSENNLSDKPNSTSDAQARDRMALRDRLIELAGDALADPARSVHAANPYPLMVLLNATPNSPACTIEEIEQAVISSAAWHRGRNRLMVNWELAVRMACELRDKRLQGVPVKPVTGTKATANPAAFGEDEWRKVIRISLHKGHWLSEYGPAPGAEGSLVPASLVGLWVGSPA